YFPTYFFIMIGLRAVDSTLDHAEVDVVFVQDTKVKEGAFVGYYHRNIIEIRDDLLKLNPTFLAGALKAVEELNWRRRKFFDMLGLNKGYKQKDVSPLVDLIAFRKVVFA
ncbi:long chain acyl-CoA synthetase 1, partial [Striga asiatica]